MVCRYKVKPGKSHSSEGAEAWHGNMDFQTQQIHKNVWTEVS